MKEFRPLLPLAVTTLLSHTSHAGLLVYEPFNYGIVGSDLLGGNGGIGFSGPWVPGGFNTAVSDNTDVAAGSLSFGGLPSSGNSTLSSVTAGSLSGVSRPLTTQLGNPGSTVYLSFLVRPVGTLGQGAFNGFFGLTLESPGEPEAFVGKAGGGSLSQYVMEDRGGTGQVASGLSAVAGETAFLVLKAQFTAGLDTLMLYTNPLPGGPEPLSGVVKNDSNFGQITGLTLYSSGAYQIDELPIGDTFADVTPANVPEPGVSTLGLTIAALTLVGATHRHTSRRSGANPKPTLAR